MSKVNLELVKELRSLTQAGMNACKDALVEADGDLQKAVDIVKAKGLQNASNRAGRVASEGRVALFESENRVTIVEVNCQTDFVANSPAFVEFTQQVGAALGATNFLALSDISQVSLHGKSLEDLRKEISASTGENVVIRRWMVEEVGANAGIASYVHSNKKLAVAVSFETSNQEALTNPTVRELFDGIAMQVAAMNPLAVSRDRVSEEEVTRQRGIFETQLREANKPEAAWPKILDGKFNKWYTETCLLDQESVVTPKKSIATLLKEVGDQVGCELKVLNFIRCQVGEGIEKKEEDLAQAVSDAIEQSNGR